ncbi:MAG TPA: dihydroxy-acid dehydratase [Candidatus Hydrogenedentes bacterium]|nr:dihydroxy-acid dehydratase [Candidatus Hydrogenedentota bacterium]HPG65875.1 dihydroxy-acid dehydratase [Candidatus Hydrogenedentota bacterium]
MTDNGATGINRNLTSYGDLEFSKYMRRAFLASAGYDREDLARPIIGIVDTSSDYNTCHRQMPEMVQAVKRGVLEAGGLPFAFPTISLHEINTSPTTMLFRNLEAMDTEEMIRAQPMDAVVLCGGCDKTVPAQVMGAVSADVPVLYAIAGPMITGRWRGERLGACTDCRRFWARHRAGELSDAEIREVEESLCFTGGTCMVMGTASTLACLVEVLGLMLPGGATAPHASGDRLRHCVATGRHAVAMARANRRPSTILTRASFNNALIALTALGGSTNAIVHLLAIARRAGIALSLDDFDAVARRVPLLVDCKPAGVGYQEDLHHAGGVPTLMKALETIIDGSALTPTGRTWAEVLENVAPPGAWQTTIRTLDAPLGPTGALAVLHGSLAPDGAVMKVAAATKTLLRHRGPAVVFESPEDTARIDDPALGITPDHVMILRNAGPVGAGMPEAGSLPIPKYLAAKGVKDMVRVSDARMSGTAYGTVVLHCSPEAAIGGPLALVRNGDLIDLDVESRRVDLLVDEAELEKRRDAWTPPPKPARGWRRLYADRVLQANLGADLDFL